MHYALTFVGLNPMLNDLRERLAFFEGLQFDDTESFDLLHLLDAPFNLGRSGPALWAATAMFDGRRMADLADRLAGMPSSTGQPLRLFDTRTAREIGRIEVGTDAATVLQLLQRVPPLEHAGSRAEALDEAPAESPTAAAGERRINAWFGDAAAHRPLQAGLPTRLCFRVGAPVAGALGEGDELRIDEGEMPPGGLATHWVLWSSQLELAALAPGVTVDVDPDGGAPATWTARFPLRIPVEGESDTVQLQALARAAGRVRLDLLIFSGAELYRQLVLEADALAPSTDFADFADTAGTGCEGDGDLRQQDRPRMPAAHVGIATSHEWTTPPGRFSISLVGNTAILGGTSMGPDANGQRSQTSEVGVRSAWRAQPAQLKGPIENLLADAEALREQHSGYLDDLPAADLLARLAQPLHPYQWDPLPCDCDAAHLQAWQRVERSEELRRLAASGRELFDKLFPAGQRLRQVIEFLTPGHRIDIDWPPDGSANWVPHVPWGLLYMGEVPLPGQPLDPALFFGLRFRLGYTSTLIDAGTGKALGSPHKTYGTHLLYQGESDGGSPGQLEAEGNADVIGSEAAWQRGLVGHWPNQMLWPSGQADALLELRQQMASPEPKPLSLLYLYCHSGGQPGNPLLRFGPPMAPRDLQRYDLRGKAIAGAPLVFANACATATADPYLASWLKENFFERGCRAYIGTEIKVPPILASRFALVFFHYFYRKVAPEPMAAGEAVTQARLFLWNRYRNLGGLLYSQLNSYELFMADDDEVRAMR